MSKRKVSVEDKIYAVNLYLDGKESQRRIASMFDVSIASVQQWIRNYQSMGAEAFIVKGNKKYSKELKQQAVSDYLAGLGSQDDICKKYGIRSKGKLQIWIKKYNGHEELKSSGTGGHIIMTKGRKTTFEERVDIVQYCIAHDRNYAATAEKYQVSYQQARSYTVKYEAGGVESYKQRKNCQHVVPTGRKKFYFFNCLLDGEQFKAISDNSFLHTFAYSFFYSCHLVMQ